MFYTGLTCITQFRDFFPRTTSSFNDSDNDMDGFTFAYFCIIPGKMIQHGYQEILIELERTGKLQETKSLLSACFDLALKS